MSIICPTVLADTVDEYHYQIEVVRGFASRIQIDLGDGHFTAKTVEISDVWWPEHMTADIHLMYKDPVRMLPELIVLQPDMVIIHAESESALEALHMLRDHNIGTGVALLQDTSVEKAADLIRASEHVLIFSGSLGSFGGRVDFSLLQKVPQIRTITPDIEVGWDGGINAENARKLADGGIDVLNVGGAIQHANHPENAYRDLTRQLYD